MTTIGVWNALNTTYNSINVLNTPYHGSSMGPYLILVFISISFGLLLTKNYNKLPITIIIFSLLSTFLTNIAYTIFLIPLAIYMFFNMKGVTEVIASLGKGAVQTTGFALKKLRDWGKDK